MGIYANFEKAPIERKRRRFADSTARVGLRAPAKPKPNYALDLLNISVAGLRDGVGPLLTLYLVRETHLDPTKLSWVLAAPAFSCLFSQMPMGVLYDRLADKRFAIASGALLLGLASLFMSATNEFAALILLQICCGLAMCLLSVGIPAVSLASSNVEGLGARLARNEIFSKAGNFGAIALTGFIAQKFSLHWIFYLVAIFAAPVIFASLMLPKVRVSFHRVEIPLREKLSRIAGHPQFLKLLVLSFLFQFGNASLLTIFEQSYAKATPLGGAGLISTAIFFTQLVIMGVSLVIARSRMIAKPLHLMMFGFAMIAVRALIFAAFGSGETTVISLGAAQLLDGAIAATIIIVPIRAIAAIDRDNFNVMSGILGTCVALGAALSTLSAGLLIKHVGFTTAFGAFALVAALGLVAAFLYSASERRA